MQMNLYTTGYTQCLNQSWLKNFTSFPSTKNTYNTLIMLELDFLKKRAKQMLANKKKSENNSRKNKNKPRSSEELDDTYDWLEDEELEDLLDRGPLSSDNFDFSVILTTKDILYNDDRRFKIVLIA